MKLMMTMTMLMLLLLMLFMLPLPMMLFATMRLLLIVMSCSPCVTTVVAAAADGVVAVLNVAFGYSLDADVAEGVANGHPKRLAPNDDGNHLITYHELCSCC